MARAALLLLACCLGVVAGQYEWGGFVKEALEGLVDDRPVSEIIGGRVVPGDPVQETQLEDLIDAARDYLDRSGTDDQIEQFYVDAWVIQPLNPTRYYWRDVTSLDLDDDVFAGVDVGDLVSEPQLAELARTIQAASDQLQGTDSWTPGDETAWYVEEQVLSDSLAARMVDFDLSVRGDAVQDLAANLALLLEVRGKFVELEERVRDGIDLRLSYRVAAADEADAVSLESKVRALEPESLSSTELNVLFIGEPTVTAVLLSGPIFDDDAFRPRSYSTSEIVDELHDFWHVGDNNFSADDAGYRRSVAGVAVLILLVGLVLLLVLCCFTCCSRHRGFRLSPGKCCFGPYSKKKREKRRWLVFLIFLASGVVVLGAFWPRDGFHLASKKISNRLDDLAGSLRIVEGAFEDVLDHQVDAYLEAADDLGCPNTILKEQVEKFADERLATNVADALEKVDGLPSDLRKVANKVDKQAPRLIDLFLVILVGFFWLCIFAGMVALFTETRRDDFYAASSAALLLLLATVCLAAMLAVSVTIADFCHEDSTVVVEVAEDRNIVKDDVLEYLEFFVTCAGENPIRNLTQPVWEGIVLLDSALKVSADLCTGDGYQDLVAVLDESKRSLYAADTEAGCANVNPIYYAAVYEATCDDLLGDGLYGLLAILATASALLWLANMALPCVNYATDVGNVGNQRDSEAEEEMVEDEDDRSPVAAQPSKDRLSESAPLPLKSEWYPDSYDV